MNQYPQSNSLGYYNQYNAAQLYSSPNCFPPAPPIEYNFNSYNVYQYYPQCIPIPISCPPPILTSCPPPNVTNFQPNAPVANVTNFQPNGSVANVTNYQPNGPVANVPIPQNQYPYVQNQQANPTYYSMTYDAQPQNYNTYTNSSKNVSETTDRKISTNNHTRLPSPDSFIRECKSGKKSTERLSKEKRIENDLKRKSDSPEKTKSVQRWKSRESYIRDTPPRREKFHQKPKTCSDKKQRSEEFLKRWRLNNCNDEKEWEEKMEKLSTMDPQEILKLEGQKWSRNTPAELYYTPSPNDPKVLHATDKCTQLSQIFKESLVDRSEKIKASKPAYELPPKKLKLSRLLGVESDESDSEESHSDDEGHENEAIEELKRKQQHPDRLHPELWYNEKGELNDGPLCRCSRKARKNGIRHNYYCGENVLPRCDLNSNNADKLYHYRITISPPTNFLINTPTIIKYDDHEFIFEGFSLLSHFALETLPACKVIRFNLSYTILYVEEKIPDNFTILELDLFYQYFFKEILELVDFDLRPPNMKEEDKSCPIFHFMPRFVRDLPDNGREILSMCHVLRYLIDSSEPLINEKDLPNIQKAHDEDWQETVKDLKGSIVTKPSMKPCSIRIDQLDRDISSHPDNLYPDIIHFGIRPPQLSYAGSKKYQRLWRTYVKFRHLLANMPKPSMEDKLKLHNKEMELQKMRCESKFKRGVTVVLSSEGFHKTGIMCDVVQHAMLIPVLVCHLRFHRSLDCLEKKIGYKFKNRCLLQLALTHPSYRENYGTNPDHVRNILTNCGIRQPEYGDRRIHYLNTRKRGINTLINIMSRFGNTSEKQSSIMHNERLEFLGDAVIEFITSIHLFHLFPEIEEGGLATYRAAIVQNQHLTIMAQELELHQYMLFAHGSDLCHDLELRHAMANCFEALLGALYLDGGIEVADKVFSETYFAKRNNYLFDLWHNYPLHPIQEQEPDGDRKWISTFPVLQKLTEFEDSIGVKFKHIRLLARAFTDRSIGFTNLTLGSNQRLEFLGDTILQLICSLYLYKHFPDHHEGHLSLLRSSLVNNKTQAVVCDDLGMSAYAVYANPKDLLKVKDRADLLEAFLGALYIDKGMVYCEEFCHVCFFPRLQYFIMRQDWNDPKSKLQQCCLTLRSMEGREPDIPVYKVIECKGPTNGRTYTVAVYFKGQRLAAAHGHNIQQAEMNAASKALENSKDLFPHLEFQKRAIYKSIEANKRIAESPEGSRSKRYYR